MGAIQTLIQLSLLADLKAQPVAVDTRVLVVGKNAIDDGLGGFYRWDPTNVTAEDTQFLNVVASDLTPTGRWVRVFQRAKAVPQGVLVSTGGVKTLYVATVTDANGEAKINLTTDNTPTGPAIFTEIWKNQSMAKGGFSSFNNAIGTYVKIAPETTSLKTTTHGFFKYNAVTFTVGLLYSPIAAAVANVPVNFEIVGI